MKINALRHGNLSIMDDNCYLKYLEKQVANNFEKQHVKIRTMGSNKIQGELWGKHPENWSLIQESTGNAGYKYVLDFIEFKPTDKLLDVGCGSGFFSNLAHNKGIDVVGIDASTPLIEQAKQRNSSIKFLTGEMEELPFEDNTFDIVCAFNSIQYV